MKKTIALLALLRFHNDWMLLGQAIYANNELRLGGHCNPGHPHGRGHKGDGCDNDPPDNVQRQTR
jgi:hypothetical protein